MLSSIKKPKVESIFEVDTEKVEYFKLGKDSQSMAFFAYLEKDVSGLILDES